MLVLTRRLGEKLIIGDEIEFQVLEIQGSQVRIGIDAPKSVHIVREEIIGKPRAEKPNDSVHSESIVAHPAAKRPRLGLYGRGNRNDHNT